MTFVVVVRRKPAAADLVRRLVHALVGMRPPAAEADLVLGAWCACPLCRRLLTRPNRRTWFTSCCGRLPVPVEQEPGVGRDSPSSCCLTVRGVRRPLMGLRLGHPTPSHHPPGDGVLYRGVPPALLSCPGPFNGWPHLGVYVAFRPPVPFQYMRVSRFRVQVHTGGLLAPPCTPVRGLPFSSSRCFSRR